MNMRLLGCFLLSLYVGNSYADEVIWKGKVNSNGTPTELIALKLHDQYQIKASHFINLGKWVQAGENLANDACFEFSDKTTPNSFEALRNSQDIPICDGEYHSDHLYLSKSFTPKQNQIFFWVFDTDYHDNSGSLEVEVIHISN